MQQKQLYFIIGIVLFLGFRLGLEAQDTLEAQDRAFYAISSLKSHLKSSFSSTAQDRIYKISFEDADVAHLWLLAATNFSVQSRIQEAQAYYEDFLSQAQDFKIKEELFQKAYTLLQETWEELNPYFSEKHYAVSLHLHYPNFDGNPHITQNMRQEMLHLLPKHSPLRTPLDQIFNHFRAIENPTSFAEAGFITLYHQPYSRIRVAKHVSLPGYLVKLYLDSDTYAIKGKACWWRLTQRCIGAKNVRKLIKEKNLVHFTVPDKWLYPLSLASFSVLPPRGSIQPVILIVTDMDLTTLDESVEAWQNKVTYRHLDELYCILSHGFASGFLSINIPYCKNGKFACVDTENPKKEVDMEHVKAFLSPTLHAYWDELVKKGGKI